MNNEFKYVTNLRTKTRVLGNFIHDIIQDTFFLPGSNNPGKSQDDTFVIAYLKNCLFEFQFSEQRFLDQDLVLPVTTSVSSSNVSPNEGSLPILKRLQKLSAKPVKFNSRKQQLEENQEIVGEKAERFQLGTSSCDAAKPSSKSNSTVAFREREEG